MQNDKMKTLLLGTSGFLGRKLYHKLRDKLDITPAYHRHRLKGGKYVDLASPADLKCCLDYDIIINSAGLSNVDFCEEHPATAFLYNTKSVSFIKDFLQNTKTLFVQLSTDFVFNGQKGYYVEDDKKDPLNFYGKCKSEAEDILTSSSLEYLILRVSTLYGYNDGEDKNHFVKWVYTNLKEGKEIRVVNDQIVCPTLIDNVADALFSLLGKNQRGIFHVVGKTPTSKYSFSLDIARSFHLDKNLITRIHSEQLHQKAMRPKNTSLHTGKLNALRIEMDGVHSGLETMKKQMEGLL